MVSTGFSFGTPNPTAAATGTSGGGFSFGTPNPTGAATGTSSGFSFGGASTGGSTGSTGFGFGGSQPAGAPAAATGFGGFGGTSTPGTSTATTGFSFGGSGSGGTATSSSGFSFATPVSSASTASTGFNFASGTAAAKPAFGFGTTPTAGTGFGTTPTAGTGFGTTPTAGTGFGTTPTAGTGFGTTPTAGTAFGTTPTAGTAFGAAPTAGTAFGTTPTVGTAFGTAPAAGTSSTGLFSNFGAKPATGFGTQLPDVNQQAQLQQPDASLALHLAICAPSYFNNENDEVLKKYNQLQAFWGAGKGYYAQNMAPVEFTPENPYCRFKTVCYAKIPSFKNEEGIVQVVVGKTITDVEPHKSQISSTLSTSVFNGAQVVIEDVYASELPNRTNIRMHVEHQSSMGEKQRAPASEVCRHMGQPNYAQIVKNLCIQDVLPLQAMTEAQKKEYLDTPQRGIDPALWEQGKRENPDPKNLLPVVRIGFQELQTQFKYQEAFAKNLQSNMDDVQEEINQLKHKQTIVKAAIQNSKWKQSNLTRRILKLASAQEVERKRGVPLDQTEEQIRMRLEDLYLQLMQPTQYRGCLNELMAQMSVKQGNSKGNPRYGLVGDKEKDIANFISKQHHALQAVVGVLKEDLQTVDKMTEEVHRKP